MDPEDNIVPVGCGTQLLIDDYAVDDIWRLRRSPELPDKHLNNPVFTGASPFEDELRTYYNGNAGCHNAGLSRPGLGVARLPKERVVARTAGDELGRVVSW